MDNKTEERLLNLFREASGEVSDRRPPDARESDAEESPQAASGSHADSTDEYPNAAGYTNAPGETSAPDYITASGYTSASGETSPFNPSLDSGAGQSYHGTSGSASASSGNKSGGIGSTLESIAGSVFGGALGLGPLVGGLFGFFDSKSIQPPVFQKYEMPLPVAFEAAETSSGLVNADYGQMGLPRLYDRGDAGAVSGGDAVNAGMAAPNLQAPSSSSPDASAGGGAPGLPQISVNVQAMDAQSFMSYSGEIAKAVRDAMLNLSSLNDVVAEL
jgi:hypothetical protein